MPNFSSNGVDVSSSPTFWTACPKCKMQYQYLRTYESYQLQCPKCKEAFLALDIHSRAPFNRAEREKEVNGKEKKLRSGNEVKDEVREKREVYRKAWVAEHSEEAMERLMVNCKEQEMDKDAGKEKSDGLAGRKLKRKKQNNEHEYDEDLADDNPKNHEQRMQDEQSFPALPGHGRSGAKKNAAAHIIDISDNSDLDDIPDAERGKIEGGAKDGVKSVDEEAGLQQREKLLKDKYVGNGRNQYGRRAQVVRDRLPMHLCWDGELD